MIPAVSFDVAEVRARLDLLRRLDRGLSVFGASSHQHRFARPLDESQVETFEREHGLHLPEDYRLFLTEVGNGGAGPFYGIFALGEMDDGADTAPWTDGVLTGDLQEPFPHTSAWNLPEHRFQPPEVFDSDEAEEAWHEALDADYFDSSLMNGAIPICHHGCALRTWLVVAGPERGYLWFDGRADHRGLSPHEDAAGQRLTFGAWYCGWLSESLAKVARPDA